jgi:hypothetical protein
MSRTLEGIVGDLMTNSETGEVYSPARVVESRIREAYALGAASRASEGDIGWMDPDDIEWGRTMGRPATVYWTHAESTVRVRITVEPEEGI